MAKYQALLDDCVCRLYGHKDADFDGKKIQHIPNQEVSLTGSMKREEVGILQIQNIEFVDETGEMFKLNLMFNFRTLEAWFANGYNRVGPLMDLRLEVI